MLLDNATVESNFTRFIERIIKEEAVFYLENENGVANSLSNDDEKTVVLMFWSDKAYAKRAEKNLKEHFKEEIISLFDFLYRWLPGMSADQVLSGVNWNKDLVGKEIDPYDLRQLIEEKMPPKLVKKYEENYDKMINQ